jgi:GDP-mannose 6-dehydrogenase
VTNSTEIHDDAPENMRVAVIGLGYVGCVTAACLADLGHKVTGVDRDAHKVDSVNRGEAPFYEPGLEELVRSGRKTGTLSATRSIAEAVRDSDIALLCVGTPSERNGNINLTHLQRVCLEITPLLDDRDKPLIVAVRSTVFPGSCEGVVMDALGHGHMSVVVANPEFLREGSAVQDFVAPSLLVVGGSDAPAVKTVAALYASLPVRPCLVSLRTAEMIKYACNAFHALKISFANEIGTLAAQLGIEAEEVMDTLCEDTKLNVSRAYLKPGFAFGGSCLPKDLRALVYRASRMDLDLPLIESVLPSNQEHLSRAIRDILELPGKVGIFGLSFKENTDDLRESPVVTLIEQLLGKGRELRVYDPQIKLSKIYGSNLSFVLAALPHINKLMVHSLDDLLSWSDHVVVTQKPAAEASERLVTCGVNTLDLLKLSPRKPHEPATAVIFERRL